jgi:hypothetical protein
VAAVGDSGVQPVEILGLAHIALHTGHVVADFLDRRIEFGLPPSADEDVRALLDESLGSGQANAGGTAGDYRRLALEEPHRSCLSLVLDRSVKN